MNDIEVRRGMCMNTYAPVIHETLKGTLEECQAIAEKWRGMGYAGNIVLWHSVSPGGMQTGTILEEWE